MTELRAAPEYLTWLRELRSARAHLGRRGVVLVGLVAFVGLVALLGLAIFGASSAHAHALAPSLLELRLQDDGAFDVTWRTPAMRPVGVTLVPELPASCDGLSQAQPQRSGSAVVSRWRVRCANPGLEGEVIGIRGLARSKTAGLVRVFSGEQLAVSALLHSGEESFVVATAPTRAQVLSSYLGLGFRHILAGIDHLVFVLGLVLLLSGRAKLVAAISAFTVGHSLTLGLAVLDVVRVSQPIVEVGIAFSIALVAVEVVTRTGWGGLRPGLVTRRPWLASGGFGLLHGLGFASVLKELGLPPAEIPLALFSFNVGIEIGQIAFVLSLAAVGAVFVRVAREPHPKWRGIAAYAMGSLAMFWCFERLWSALP